MHKILLILKREYFTRVRKRSFIISTILLPILYVAIIFGTALIGAKGKTKLHVAIVDSSGYFDKGRIERANIADRDSSAVFTLVNENADSMKTSFKQKGYDGFIVIPHQASWEKGFSSLLQMDKTMGSQAVIPAQNKLNEIWNSIKNEKLGISDSIKLIMETSKVVIRPTNINDEKANSSIASTIGYTSGILIYIILLLYGSQVMMGVMEEKTNRIAEVIVSSVKPFQLMVGKIIGIGMVALTQFLLWIAFIFIIYNITKVSGGSSTSMNEMVGGVQRVFTSINVPLIIFCFIFYLLAGFFFYASLYAAVGSAANEDMREAQSLGFPITMLVIFSLTIMTASVNNPTGSLAVWASIIPFSSPIVMMGRIAFGVPTTVPWWQLGASMVSLIAGFILTAWFAGKIYRTGILMYGKKPSWKELLKWAFRKN
jgi:ABC-2 type transport system permease protein